ncbi:uncharacterized protein LOC107823783 [Nicotiana tabacum]|uniref:uncharacterized protein LOC107823783 n=1 Tax=Nicotiana tabacum TaxID=4097 RepID=UPI003F4F2939
MNYAILLNGKTTKPFDAARELSQGDFMSSFLFAIAMEYLGRKLKALKHEKTFDYHPMCSRLDLTHLSFVDDLLLFTRGYTTYVVLFHQKFNTFSEASRIKENLAKSSIYYGGVSNELKHEIQQALAISSWTAKKLSYAGRIQLVQTVIFNIQAYWAQIFIIPAKVIKAIEVQERMLTADKLKKWGMPTHALAANSVSSYRLMGSKSPMDSYETKGRSQMARVLKLVYAVYIHALWIDRNSRILEKQTTAWEVLARRVACMCNFRAKGYTRVLLSNEQTEMVYSV